MSVCFIDGPEAIAEVDVAGRSVRFEFHRYCGPVVVGKRGEPLLRQPGHRSPFWPAFEAWLDARRKVAA